MSYREAKPSVIGKWFLHASATFAGALAAGIVLLLCIRLYIYWSITDTIGKFKEGQALKTAK